MVSQTVTIPATAPLKHSIGCTYMGRFTDLDPTVP